MFSSETTAISDDDDGDGVYSDRFIRLMAVDRFFFFLCTYICSTVVIQMLKTGLPNRSRISALHISKGD